MDADDYRKSRLICDDDYEYWSIFKIF